MSIRCEKCKREYDVTLFEFGREIICECGNVVHIQHKEIICALENFANNPKEYLLTCENEKLEKIKQLNDKIVFLILHTDYQKIDIEIEKQKLKDLIKELFPDKFYLYDLIYEPRFNRLWQQFRCNMI